MTEPQTLSAYFTYCKLQKNLDNKTLKAYQIDLKQFVDFYPNPTTVTRTDMELYIEHLMERYKASTVKRKIAALKAYYHYLVYEEILEHSPFEKIQLHIRQEILLPRTIVQTGTRNCRPLWNHIATTRKTAEQFSDCGILAGRGAGKK